MRDSVKKVLISASAHIPWRILLGSAIVAVVYVSVLKVKATDYCLPPEAEYTGYVGPSTVSGFPTAGAFNQTITDIYGDIYNGTKIQEYPGQAGSDSCHFTGSPGPYLYLTPSGLWTVDGPPNVTGQTNHWGYDNVGWSQASVTYYRQHGRAQCGFTVYQLLTWWCCTTTGYSYIPPPGNVLTGQINISNVVNCRYDLNNSACGTINQ
jgi:hypothetical protein